jgi:hypothetical protein
LAVSPAQPSPALHKSYESFSDRHPSLHLDLMPRPDDNRPFYFFPYHLRQTTLEQISCVRFRKGCRCSTWLLLDNKEWTTTGAALRFLLFTGVGRAWQLPTPKATRKVYEFVTSMIEASEGHPVFIACPACTRRYDHPRAWAARAR